MSDQLSKNILSAVSWTAFQTVGTKLISLGSQLVLAWLLLPEEFGKVSIAASLTSVTFLIQGLGLSDVLISRGHMYGLVFNLSKSLAFITSVICFIITISVAFIFGIIIYDDIEITYLVLIFSLAVPFNAMSIVADARLRIDLKFKQLSSIRLTEFFISKVLLLIFVLLNLGIYSFVIAPLIASILRYFMIHKLAKVSHKFVFTLSHYRFLLTNSIYIFFHNLFQTLIRHSDYLIIGLFVTTQSVGIYFMGYSLSVQVISLLVGSLAPVFFPVLKKIPPQDTHKLRSVLLKIVTVFSMFGMCFSLLQAALAESLIKIFLNDTWLDVILLVQILSIGIGFNVASTVWAVSFRLNEDFKKMAIYSFFSALIFMVLVMSFTYKFSIIGTAIAVSCFNVFVNLSLLLISLKKYKINSLSLLFIIFKYFIFASMVFSLCYYLSNLLVLNQLLMIVTKGVIPTLIYFSVLYLFDNDSKVIFNLLVNKILRRNAVKV